MPQKIAKDLLGYRVILPSPVVFTPLIQWTPQHYGQHQHWESKFYTEIQGRQLSKLPQNWATKGAATESGSHSCQFQNPIPHITIHSNNRDALHAASLPLNSVPNSSFTQEHLTGGVQIPFRILAAREFFSLSSTESYTKKKVEIRVNHALASATVCHQAQAVGDGLSLASEKAERSTTTDQSL